MKNIKHYLIEAFIAYGEYLNTITRWTPHFQTEVTDYEKLYQEYGPFRRISELDQPITHFNIGGNLFMKNFIKNMARYGEFVNWINR